jgi:SAM-dependent methyltransferase
MFNNKEVFGTVEFERWAYKESLDPHEKYLIEEYLDKKGKTLEAATGGGRILLEMKDLGFTSLYGFDYLPEIIEVAKKRDATHTISFEVQDATNLNYSDSSFDQIIYLQQIMCIIDDELGRLNAFKEAYRILKTGGTALFSFLNYDVRTKSIMYLPYLGYITLLRKLLSSNRSIQYLPWLKLGGKPNFSSLLDKGPYVYWYKIQEVYQILREANFEVVAIGSNYQINQKRMHTSLEALANEPIEGGLYVVCKK